MAPNVQDDMLEENNASRRNSTERHVYHVIEHIGRGDDHEDRKQRIAAIVIALVMCTAIYGALYLAMH